MEQSTALLCLVGGTILIAAALLVSAVKVIPEYARLGVFRLGRSLGRPGRDRDQHHPSQRRVRAAAVHRSATLRRAR